VNSAEAGADRSPPKEGFTIGVFERAPAPRGKGGAGVRANGSSFHLLYLLASKSISAALRRAAPPRKYLVGLQPELPREPEPFQTCPIYKVSLSPV